MIFADPKRGRPTPWFSICVHAPVSCLSPLSAKDSYTATDILKVDFLRGQNFSSEILRMKKWKNHT